jgi:hypothetical protein
LLPLFSGYQGALLVVYSVVGISCTTLYTLLEFWVTYIYMFLRFNLIGNLLNWLVDIFIRVQTQNLKLVWIWIMFVTSPKKEWLMQCRYIVNASYLYSLLTGELLTSRVYDINDCCLYYGFWGFSLCNSFFLLIR